MKKLEVTIKTLTPLWTGDVDRKCSRIKETGIIGSLRWWYEALVRGLGGYACDPTSDDKSYVHKRCPKEHGGNKKYCTACLVFGATGIRRLFRLYVSGGKPLFDGAIQIIPKGRRGGWFLGGGLVGNINLNIIPFSNDFDRSLIIVPLLIASNWGAIGARAQHGYGVVEILEGHQEVDFSRFNGSIKKITNQKRLLKLEVDIRRNSSEELPNIQEMFFAKVVFKVKDEWWKDVNGIAPRSHEDYHGHIYNPKMLDWVKSDSLPISPAIKNWIRYGNVITIKRGKKIQVSPFKEISNIEISKWIFGTSNSIKTASKINISCAYPIGDNLWEFRIWGWIPKDGIPARFDRDSFLDNLKQALEGSGSVTVPWNELLGDQTEKHKLKVWREFDSSRDTVKPNESNIDNYLQSLLRGEE